MKVQRAYLLATLALALVSVAAQEVASDDYTYLILTGVVCWYAWTSERRGWRFKMTDRLATVLSLIAFLLLMYRGISAGRVMGEALVDIQVPIVGQFLIVFQWVYLLRERKPRDDYWLYAVTVVLMGTAGLLMPGVAYGLFFVLYTLAAVCGLTMMTVWQALEADQRPVEEAPARVRPGFMLHAAPATLILLIPVAAVFLVLPRRPDSQALTPQLVRLGTQPVTGFSSTVELGEIGRLQDNPQRVMHVTISDPDTGATLRPPSLLLRGVAVESYVRDQDRWKWSTFLDEATRRYDMGEDLSRIYQDTFPGFNLPGFARIRCDITLEPLDIPLIFVPFAPLKVTTEPLRTLWVNPYTYALAVRHASGRTLTYSVISRVTEPRAPRNQTPAVAPNANLMEACLQLPEEISQRVRDLAHRIAPAAEYPTDYAKARRILEYLSDGSQFRYTRTLDATPGVEPVEDFLVNRKEGNCEYFAAAMTVLLRCDGVPARIVNGFKVTEWNPISGDYIVRQQDAHAWVEAYLRPEGWRTFDPSVLREGATPRVGVVRRAVRDAYDWADTFWVNNVLNYGADDQSRIYSAMSALAQYARMIWVRAFVLTGFSFLSLDRYQIHHFLYRLMRAAHWLALAGTVILAVAAAAMIVQSLTNLARQTRRRRRALRFYDRMLRLLADRGFERQAWQTPYEYADELTRLGWPAPKEVALITGHFCAARYGLKELGAQENARIAEALEVIRATKVRQTAQAPITKSQ